MSLAASATYNTIHKILSIDRSILYDRHKSLFDHIIYNIRDINIFDVNSKLLLDISYDIHISNTFMNNPEQANIVRGLHLNNIVIFHTDLPQMFKKEDKILLKDSLNNSNKIMMSREISDAWNIVGDRTYLCNYGIPKIPINKNKERKSIIVLNLNNNHRVDLLYNHIKSAFPDAYTLKDVSSYDILGVSDIISDYKICIDAEFLINSLFAIACGCFTISTLAELKESRHSLVLNDYSRIINILQDSIKYYDSSNIINESEYIFDKYSFDLFSEKILSIVDKTKIEAFI